VKDGPGFKYMSVKKQAMKVSQVEVLFLSDVEEDSRSVVPQSQKKHLLEMISAIKSVYLIYNAGAVHATSLLS
jgi:hypothetical protein